MSHFDKTLEAYCTISGRDSDDELKFIHEVCDISRPYSLEGMSVLGRVSRVIDGDTMRVSIPVNGHIWTFPVQLTGIDCPEIRTKNLEEKAMGFKAKEHVESLVIGHVISLKLGEFDSFGRLMGTIVTHTGINVADDLIAKGLAKKYDGGKKKPW